MKKFILSMAAVSAFMVGCNKDDENEIGRPEMIAGTWTIAQYGMDVNSNEVLDSGEALPADSAGISGTFAFNPNGNVTATVGFAGFPPTTINGQWALVDNQNALRMIDGTDTSYFEIKTLTSSQLTVLDTTDASMGQATWIVLNK